MNALIITKLFKPYKILRDWIDKDKLVWSTLSMNPNAVEMFEENKDKLDISRVVKMKEAIGFIENNLELLSDNDWKDLCENPSAIELLKKHPDKINISKICCNVNGTEILQEYIKKHSIYDTKLDIMRLCTNPSVIEILNEIYSNESDADHMVVSQIYLELLLGNPNVMDIKIMKDNLDFLFYMNIDVSSLLVNSNKELKDVMMKSVDIAVKQKRYKALSLCIFVEDIYIDKLKIFDKEGKIIDKDDMVDWYSLSKNKNAIRLIKNNLDKIDWRWLSINPAAIDILKDNLDRVNWTFLSGNPEIFINSYERYFKYLDILDIILH